MDSIDQAIQGVARMAHIAGGFAAIALFWFQALSRKGSAPHRLAGRLFLLAGWMVVIGALASIAVAVARAAAAGVGPAAEPNDFGFAILLAFLAVVAGVNLWGGAVAAGRHARGLGLSRAVLLGQIVVLAAAAAGLAGFALAYSPDLKWPLVAISLLGVNGVREQLVQLRRGDWPPERVLAEHAGAMSGAALAFHVAFALVGVQSLIPALEGELAATVVVVAVLVTVWVIADTLVQRRILSGASSKAPAGAEP